DGFHTWTEDEIAQFEAHHPIGSKPRLGLALLLYTGQRRSDVVRMGRQHIKDGVLTVKQQKTGATLAIPVHAHLQAVLDATPSEHLTFLVTATGKLYGGNAFSEQFRNWCDASRIAEARRAMMVAEGSSSCSNSSLFGATPMFRFVTPVTLPPGRLRLATSPTSTGSAPIPKTIGMLAVAAFAVSAEAVPPAATSTET